MNENRVNLPINFVHQEGAVLVVALVLLVVLTMLGISGIESTKLETRMADNVRKYNVAFQKAEAGIATTFNQCRDNAVAGNIECSGVLSADVKSQVDNLDTTCMPANNGGGSLNKLVRLTTSTGISDPGDPNAIQVTLVAGMWLPAASDNMMLKMTNKEECNKQNEKTCSLPDDVKGECKSNLNSDNCVIGIVNVANAQTDVNTIPCISALVTQACDFPNAPAGCSNTLQSLISDQVPNIPDSPPEPCKNDKNSESCQNAIKQTCEKLNAGKPPERVTECINKLSKTGDNPTPDGSNPT